MQHTCISINCKNLPFHIKCKSNRVIALNIKKTKQLLNYNHKTDVLWHINLSDTRLKCTSGSAIADGPRDVLVSRNSATTKYRYRVALFA